MIALCTALLLLAATVLIHGVGTTAWLHWLIGHFVSTENNTRQQLGHKAIILTAVVLTALHVVEILLWAVAYLVVVPNEQLKTLEAAFYFSAVTFTTLGYGDITLDSAWRVLSGVQAINGILLVGWSTAFIFAVIQNNWQAVLAETTQNRKGNSQ